MSIPNSVPAQNGRDATKYISSQVSEFRAYSNQKGVSQVTIMTVTVTIEEAPLVNEVYFQARHKASTEITTLKGFKS